MDPLPELAGYRVLRVAGAGGMGTVYEARRVVDERRVAIKVLHAHLRDDATVRARFAREGAALAAVRHPRVVTLVASLVSPPALVLAWIDGEPLDLLLRRDGPFGETRAAAIVADVADALTAVHACGYVHRDLKAANVLLDASGPCLADFGIAGIGGQPPDLTPAGVTMATPTHASPELWRGEPHDVRADVWALGVLFYELLAGVPPFTGDTLAALAAAVACATPPPLRAFRRDVAPGLDALVARLLDVDPRRRPADAAELRLRLQDWASS